MDATRIKEVTNYILRAVDNYSGDDLERAKLTFRHCTPEEMKQEYGCSGKTRSEILDIYQRERDLNLDAKEYVKSLSNRAG